MMMWNKSFSRWILPLVGMIMMMMVATSDAFTTPSFPSRSMSLSSLSSSSRSSSTTTSSSVTDFLQELLEGLAEGKGAKLLSNSADKWRTAIYEAVGAPASADETIVAKALTDAMSKSNNQFAILMGKAEPFLVNFPSDPVEGNDGEVWVECRLREKESDELLVTMGITLQPRNDGTNGWLIAGLDWQDFRDQFYPGLSGREWLRAF